MDFKIFYQIFLLFGLIAVGFITNKLGGLDETANARLSGFLLKVTLPATILSSAMSQQSLSRGEVLSAAGAAAGVFIIIPLISRLITHMLHLDNTYRLMLNYSNLGFMGLPIIQSVYGTEKVFYAAVFMMVFNVHIFTFGIMTLRGREGGMGELLKKLVTPGIISALLAFVLVLFPVKVPAFVKDLTSSVGSVTTPLAMIVIGSQLAQVNIVECLKNKGLYLMSFFKLLLYPALIYCVFSLAAGHGTVTGVAAILTGLPVAGNVTMLCSEYGGDVSLAAQGTCVSTILSLATVPLMLMLIGA